MLPTNEQQAREMAELRASLLARCVAAVAYLEPDGNMRVRVPPEQEPAFRAAMDDWTTSRTSFYFKRPQQPPAGSEG